MQHLQGTCRGLVGYSKQVTSPTKTGHQSEIARFNNNTLLYISPQTKKLHSDIFKNSPENLFHHNNDTIRASRKNMLRNFDYMIDYGELMNNPKAAKIFDDMEKYVQDSKLKIQQLIMTDQLSPNQKKDQLNLRHLLEEKRKLSQDSRDMRDSTIEILFF